MCKGCKKQFVSLDERSYKGCILNIDDKIRLMLARNCGIRDISVIEGVSCKKVLSVLTKSKYKLTPSKKHYKSLEIDEFWTYVGEKKNKKWCIYAYDRESGEVISYVFGRRDASTVKRLKRKLRELEVSYDTTYTDNWSSFVKEFKDDNHVIGKKNTQGIEGNNCHLRHRIRRAVRKTCCFSKKLFNHLKAFKLVFHYINFGYV